MSNARSASSISGPTAAQPDDEQTAVLAWFARGRHMRTAYLSLTRGEGGQNLIGGGRLACGSWVLRGLLAVRWASGVGSSS
jgi:hypothetical protein